uniref:PqqD family peptide modification chaperone n=1 Tax=Acetatifactor sp. TaxID=1872090 RepID=UPI0040573822
MRKNPYYILKYISGIPYLLTFGQGNADFIHDIRLNETGAFLWEQLDQTTDTEKLIALCAEHFQCPKEEYHSMESSIRQFLSSLYSKGILLSREEPAHSTASCYTTLEIAGLFVRLYGPAEAFAPELLSFQTSKELRNDGLIQHIRVIPKPPVVKENGTLLLRNQSLTILENTDQYIFFSTDYKNVYEAHLSKDGKQGTIYCAPKITSAGTEEISYAIRICFLFFAQLHNMLAIHSSSILYKEKLWLFSAPSGTGKSTHAELWKKLINTPIMNGDLNLITLQDNTPKVHGTPWCGTSGIYHTKSYPLGGIIFLQQGSTDRVVPLTEDQKQLYLLHRCVSSGWKESLFLHNLSIIHEIYPRILVCRLICTPTEDAVICIRNYIDHYLLS